MKILWIIIIMADNLLPLLLARFYPNYKHKEMALSVLGSRQSPVKWIYIMCGALYQVWYFVSLHMRCIKRTIADGQSLYGCFLLYTASGVKSFPECAR